MNDLDQIGSGAPRHCFRNFEHGGRGMTLLHSTVLAVTVAAIAFVGIASVTGHEAAQTSTQSGVVAPRGDRLDIASRADANYVTVEKRVVNGVSVLTRIETAHE